MNWRNVLAIVYPKATNKLKIAPVSILDQTIRKGLSEYPLKRIWIFKELSVRSSIGYALQHTSEALVTRDNINSSKRCNKAEDRTKSRRILIRSDIRLLLRIHHSIIVHAIEAYPIPNNELRG